MYTVRHPVVHYPLLLYTTSRNYDVVDLARQSNPNFFIVTPAPSRGRKLGKPTKQQKNRGEKSSKLKLYSSWWSSWKLMTSMVIVDQISRKVEVFIRGCCWGHSEAEKTADDDLHCFSLTKENLVVVVNGVSSFQKDFFLPYLPTKRRWKKGEVIYFYKKSFSVNLKLYFKIDFSPFLCFEV